MEAYPQKIRELILARTIKDWKPGRSPRNMR